MGNSFIDKLLCEHKRMIKVLDLMQRQIVALQAGRAADMELFGFALDYMRNFPAVIHHPKEDLMYYHLYVHEPRLRTDVQQLLGQHRELYELEGKLSDAATLALTQGPRFHRRLVDLGLEYLRLQHEHREIEELFTFPLARRVLAPVDWAYLDCPADEMQEPVFTTTELKRFESLFLFLTGPLLQTGTAAPVGTGGTTWRPLEAGLFR